MQKFRTHYNGEMVPDQEDGDWYLASDVDARIAELEMQLAEAKGHIETLDRSNDRLRQKIDRLQWLQR